MKPYISLSDLFPSHPIPSHIPSHHFTSLHFTSCLYTMPALEIRDEEDGTLHALSFCAPLAALRRPVDVDDLFDSGY